MWTISFILLYKQFMKEWEVKKDNTIFEMKFGRAWQIPQPLPKQKRYRNSPSKFLHSSVCVNIKLQLQKSLKKHKI